MTENELIFFVNQQCGFVAVAVPEYVQEFSLKVGEIPDHISARFDKLSVTGSQHRILIAPGVQASKATIGFKGARNTLILGSNTLIRGTIAIQGSDLTVLIGAGTTFNEVEIYCKGEQNGVFIGRDCMFSAGIEIRTSDAHSIVDLDTMQKTNHPDGVYIGDHVWVSKNVFIQKGTTVGNDSVIGFGAMTRGDNDVDNSLLVGAPAKPVAGRRITWSRKARLKETDISNLNEWKTLPIL